MKVFIRALAFICLLQSYTYVITAQTISIKKTNITIKEALSEIEKQSGYSIAYNQSKIDLKRNISVDLTNVTIEKAIEEILKGTTYTFKIKGYHIILTQSREIQVADHPRLTQSIRGIVTDATTGYPIQYASVGLLSRSEGTTTDSLGRFKLTGIPLGRYELQVSFIGYTPIIFREVSVTSSREVFLEVSLKENPQDLGEVIVHPEINKEGTLNTMVITGGRMLTVEESSRYAGGMDDPARLVTSFAGVAGSYATNAVSIHGNSPQATQWKLEGVEIPNPTHYADMVGVGGGIFTGLSSQVMGNSDFYNGAFPAEYNNALSGIIDMHMRAGNNQHFQNTFQVGLLGIDLGSEGPLSKNHNSSYIFNYRYSTTGFVTGTNLKYQDLSFKLNFPTRKAGVFSLWGLGLRDRINAAPEDSSKWETYSDREDVNTYLYRSATGITHKYLFNSSAYIKTSLAATYSGINQDVDQVNNPGSRVKVADIVNNNWDIVFNTYLNKKFGSNHNNRSGITITGLFYNLNYNISPDYGLDKPAENVVRGKGETLDIAPFTSSFFKLGSQLTLNVGMNAHLFTLSNRLSLEPRAGLKWQFKSTQALSFAYGLNSRREKLDYYFVENNHEQVNKNLNLAKAHHFVLTYDARLSDMVRLKIEPYFQLLYDVPVEKNTTFSIINHDDYYLDRSLVNKGKGRNYGIDVTLERYMNKGYYYLVTGTLFQSEYTGSDNFWRNTRLDRNYIINTLLGKEWLTGKKQNKIFGASLRLTFQGGDRYTPIDEKASLEQHEIVFDESKAYSKQYKPALNGDISLTYKINRKHTTHEFALKLLNFGGYTGQHGYYYNEQTSSIVKGNVTGNLTNFSYKIEF